MADNAEQLALQQLRHDLEKKETDLQRAKLQLQLQLNALELQQVELARKELETKERLAANNKRKEPAAGFEQAPAAKRSKPAPAAASPPASRSGAGAGSGAGSGSGSGSAAISWSDAESASISPKQSSKSSNSAESAKSEKAAGAGAGTPVDGRLRARLPASAPRSGIRITRLTRSSTAVDRPDYKDLDHSAGEDDEEDGAAGDGKRKPASRSSGGGSGGGSSRSSRRRGKHSDDSEYSDGDESGDQSGDEAAAEGKAPLRRSPRKPAQKAQPKAEPEGEESDAEPESDPDGKQQQQKQAADERKSRAKGEPDSDDDETMDSGADAAPDAEPASPEQTLNLVYALLFAIERECDWNRAEQLLEALPKSPRRDFCRGLRLALRADFDWEQGATLMEQACAAWRPHASSHMWCRLHLLLAESRRRDRSDGEKQASEAELRQVLGMDAKAKPAASAAASGKRQRGAGAGSGSGAGSSAAGSVFAPALDSMEADDGSPASQHDQHRAFFRALAAWHLDASAPGGSDLSSQQRRHMGVLTWSTEHVIVVRRVKEMTARLDAGARARFPPAMLRRGQLTYEHKLQVPTEAAWERRYLEWGHAQGHTPSTFQLAAWHGSVKRTERLALTRQCAEAGHCTAMANLGQMHWDTQMAKSFDVEPSARAAMQWFQQGCRWQRVICLWWAGEMHRSEERFYDKKKSEECFRLALALDPKYSAAQTSLDRLLAPESSAASSSDNEDEEEKAEGKRSGSAGAGSAASAGAGSASSADKPSAKQTAAAAADSDEGEPGSPKPVAPAARSSRKKGARREPGLPASASSSESGRAEGEAPAPSSVAQSRGRRQTRPAEPAAAAAAASEAD